MTKEQLEKEAKAECFMLTVNTIDIDQKDVELAYILGRKNSFKQIVTLEKEIAELKEKLEHRNCVDCSNHGSNIKLLKAKEIIKKLSDAYEYVTRHKEYADREVLAKTEQFLKDREQSPENGVKTFYSFPLSKGGVTMFEKDAEEYADKKCGKENRKTTGWVLTQDDFLKGADFGYNKCKEEINQKGLALQSDMDKTIEQNIALKKLIEQMKCCANCKYYNMDFLPYFCNKRQTPTHCTGYCDKWESE